MAFNAASAWSWICETFGITPSSVVSAAPTTATWFLRMCSTLRRTEHGEGDVVVELFERDLQLHIEFERLRRLRAIDNIAHHVWAFFKLHHGDGVRRREAGDRTVMDHIAVEFCLAAGLEHADLARAAGRAEGTRREIDMGAGVAALQPQLVRS